MNNELRQLVLEAGAPIEVIDELWFNLFCQRFADVILTNAEHEMECIRTRMSKYEQKS